MKISPLIVALDVDRMKTVEAILKKLGPQVDFYKVGMKLFTHYGPDVLKFLRRKRKKIFLDLKFHDIPNTVAEACREATRHRVQLVTLHASGGVEMMSAAVRAVRETARRYQLERPLLMGVTVLTSMDDLKELGIRSRIPQQVLRLARLAKATRMDGVICSPHELAKLRQEFPKKFIMVTPGVRPLGSDRGDQKRVMTPEQAFRLGSDAIVMGRPIIAAKDPQAVVAAVLRSQSRG